MNRSQPSSSDPLDDAAARPLSTITTPTAAAPTTSSALSARFRVSSAPIDAERVALLAELDRVRQERDAALAARDAEREHAALLQEQLVFLQEQIRSMRDFTTADLDLVALHAEREALLQEIAMLDEELHVRALGGPGA